MIEVLESLSKGKSPLPEKNEDRLVVTDDFVAVIDGSTSKSGKLIDGRTGGVFAADFAAGFIRDMAADISSRGAIDGISQGLKSATAATRLFGENEELPTVALAVYSRRRGEIWRVGDIALLLDGVMSLNEKDADRIVASARAIAIEIALLGGASVEEIAKEDIGRAYIMPILKNQHLFANKAGAFGYGVINGAAVPDAFIDVTDVGAVSEIVMASDGYPQLLPTLAQSEDKLAEILKEDPLLYKRHRSTKGMQAGNASFDDRTYVRFRR